MIDPEQNQGGAEILNQRAIEFEKALCGVEYGIAQYEAIERVLEDVSTDDIIGSLLLVECDIHNIDWSLGSRTNVGEVTGRYAGRMLCYGVVPRVEIEKGNTVPGLAVVASTWVDRFLFGPSRGLLGTSILDAEIAVVQSSRNE